MEFIGRAIRLTIAELPKHQKVGTDPTLKKPGLIKFS